MKYYGIKDKVRKEDITYCYWERKARLLSKIPGKIGKRWETEHYEIFSDLFPGGLQRHIQIPEGKHCELYEIVTLDLIKREDMRLLQRGLKRLLMKFRSSRFIGSPTDTIEELYRKINLMDSSLARHYDGIDCGYFDFTGMIIQNTIDHFGIRIRNINTSFLGIEFTIVLSESKAGELNDLIENEYLNPRGYINESMVQERPRGAKKFFGWTQYNMSSLKADRIYELLSCIQWEFYQELKNFFPLLLHSSGVMPPRIDVYSTDIDYQDEDENDFWPSIGVLSWDGQFIDKNHKIFFYTKLSERYREESLYSRMIYIYREDGYNGTEYIDIKTEVYHVFRDYAWKIITLMALNLLCEEAGKTTVKYKAHLNKIKLKRNKLKRLLKLRYQYEVSMDNYKRMVKDQPWERCETRLRDLFSENDDLTTTLKSKPMTSWRVYYESTVENVRGMNEEIELLEEEFEQKQAILQRLYDYKNTKKTWILGLVTLLVALATLYFTMNQEHGKVIVERIQQWTKALKFPIAFP